MDPNLLKILQAGGFDPSAVGLNMPLVPQEQPELDPAIAAQVAGQQTSFDPQALAAVGRQQLQEAVPVAPPSSMPAPASAPGGMTPQQQQLLASALPQAGAGFGQLLDRIIFGQPKMTRNIS